MNTKCINRTYSKKGYAFFAVGFIYIIQISCFSQNVAINTNHAPADPSAMLGVNSTIKGMYIPCKNTEI